MCKYWKPKFKYEYVGWFVAMDILTASKANKKSLKQLQDKYNQIRSKE